MPVDYRMLRIISYRFELDVYDPSQVLYVTNPRTGSSD